jgi:hypothetical protein
VANRLNVALARKLGRGYWVLRSARGVGDSDGELAEDALPVVAGQTGATLPLHVCSLKCHLDEVIGMGRCVPLSSRPMETRQTPGLLDVPVTIRDSAPGAESPWRRTARILAGYWRREGRRAWLTRPVGRLRVITALRADR